MTYKAPAQGAAQQHCDVCGSPANSSINGFYLMVDCSRCGDFQLDRETPDDFPLTTRAEPQRALASSPHTQNAEAKRSAHSGAGFFTSLPQRSLPTPVEMSDNLLLWIDAQVEGRPGSPVSIPHNSPRIAASIGAIDGADVFWAVRNLEEQNLVKGTSRACFTDGWITASGWARIEELKRAHLSSRYAFFARKFKNDELDTLYKDCLRRAVAETGYDLLPVTQRAGRMNSIIEDEIRRCRFLIADLSDDNAGAYWEAGFAEGLGKDVIYICREKEKDGKTDKKTHFDTDHRQTVRWDLGNLGQTATRTKSCDQKHAIGRRKAITKGSIHLEFLVSERVKFMDKHIKLREQLLKEFASLSTRRRLLNWMIWASNSISDR